MATYLNELNEAIQGALEVGGEAFVSNAVLGDVYALRMCVVNFRTMVEDVEELAVITERVGAELDAEQRPESLRRAPATSETAATSEIAATSETPTTSESPPNSESPPTSESPATPAAR